MRTATRDKIRRINQDQKLNRQEKTQKIQDILSGNHLQNVMDQDSAKPATKPPTRSQGNTIFDTVKGIKYSNQEKESKYVAAGVNIVSLPSNRPDEEFCIFSQEKLSRCENVGAIVVSSTQQGQLEWSYLCNPAISLDDTELNGVHLFDVDYVVQWVEKEGAEYIQCPLCRSGSKQKRNVEEHDIETMQSLQERRNNASREGDQQMLFFVESLMLTKALSEKWDPSTHSEQFNVNREILKQVCTHWMKRWSPNEFGRTVNVAVDKALQVDNVQMLEILFDEMFQPSLTWAKLAMKDFLTIAAKYGAVDSVRLLLNLGATQDIEAPALTQAIKTRNQPLVDIIIESMHNTQNSDDDSRSFVCGTLFPDVIKYNMVEAAQAIIENRWHKPTSKDLELAKSVDNDVYKYLDDRQSAALSLCEDDGDLDLDDWGDDDDMDEDDW